MTTIPTPDRETWLTVHDASAMLGVSPATLRRWSAAGEVEAFTTPGGHRRFALTTLQALLHPGSDGCPDTAELFSRFRSLLADELRGVAAEAGLAPAEASALLERGSAAADRALATLTGGWPAATG